MLRWGRSQERRRDQKPSIVLKWTSALVRGCPGSLTLMGQVCSCHAIQAQRRAPSSHSARAPPGHELASVIADGAYNRDPVYQAATARQAGSPPEVVVPPRADAVLGTADPDQQTPRDRHVQPMAERGRIGWQRATGHGRRNHVETTMDRDKHLIGPKLRARSRPAQLGEVALAIQVLNRMIRTAKPVSVRC